MKMLRILILLIPFLFLSCDDSENLKPKNEAQEVVQIEQNDEKTELSDYNLPLPVDDELNFNKDNNESKL